MNRTKEVTEMSLLFFIMAKDFAKPFYNSGKWKRCKNSYIQYRILIDGGKCEQCKRNLGYIVHHKVILTELNINNPDVTLSFDNLEYVCKDCHDKFDGHFKPKSNDILPVIFFDEDGQPLPHPPV